ncbi:ABC transporter ATP-binding protein [Marivibrio halodurans]|uniref:ABC transporter ATP-binding protein n=1 Tax=Marivibrio halodurans TaxID=2039722 RepID=A0A8J7S177_9PROT|nr:ABC transporter ATP-binding protein [Marivibrio halodurans]MBP5858380.1 ABC transporter ATP-binding protein [Marivibrio halodurans]
MTVLTIESLTKQFRGLRAIEDVTLTVERDSITSIVGPNGAGKSTLFNMVSGYLKPTSGRIEFDGHDITGMAPYRICRQGVARAFQISKPFPELSVQENVLVAASFGRAGERDAKATTTRAIDICHLTPLRDRRAGSLSIGNLRRLELARAIAARPILLLADEPCAGLNDAETRELTNVLSKIRDSGVTILLVEHDIKAVRRVSDRVVVLEAGRKIADGSATDVFSDQAVIDAYLGTAPA